MAFPLPTAGELTLYLLGPGFGESVVFRLPGGQTVVVDNSGAPTLDLLNAMGIGPIDLLVLTHPDLDHLGDLDHLLTRHPPALVWTWPLNALLRDFLIKLGGGTPGLRDLKAAYERLEALGDVDQHTEVRWGSVSSRVGDLTLHVLSPGQADINQARRDLAGLLDWPAGQPPELARGFARRLEGTARPGDHPNIVSLALAGCWGHWKILLGGDLEVGTGHQGWQGALARLDARNEGHLVEDIDFIKLSHHGSMGAWHNAVWDRHARNRPVKAALIAPFSRSHLPKAEVFSRLRIRARGVAVSSGGVHPGALATGWVPKPSAAGESLIVLRLRADGTHEIEAFGDAKHYEQPPPVATPTPSTPPAAPPTPPSSPTAPPSP